MIEQPRKIKKGITFKVKYILPNEEADITVEYSIYSNGILNVDYLFKPIQKELPSIPRLGMHLTLPKQYTNVPCYGKGLNESYWGRKTEVKIGIYSDNIKEQFHIYSCPQEIGNKTDVHWMQLASQQSSSKTLLNVSIWLFAMTELGFNSDKGSVSASRLIPVTKKHGAGIIIGETIQWNIDYQEIGLDGATSWGRLVHDEYTIPANRIYQYSFTIKTFK